MIFGTNTRKTLIAAGLALLAIAASRTEAAAQTASALDVVHSTKVLTVGWAEWNPLEHRNVETNQLTGLLIDVATHVAEGLGAKPEFVEDNWATLATGAGTGKFQIAIEGITPERARVCDFSHPLYYSVFTALVLKGSKYHSWDELNTPGVTISVTTGSSVDQVLTNMEAAGEIKATIVRIKDVGEDLLAVTSRKVDAYTDALDALLADVAQDSNFEVVSGSFGKSLIGIALPKGDDPFRAAVDKVVVDLIKQGTLRKLLDQYKIVGNTPAETD